VTGVQTCALPIYEIYDANDSELKHINYFFFTDEHDFDSRFEQLFEIIRTDYDYKEQHTTLELRAQESDRRDRNVTFVLIGDELADAQTWLENSKGKEPEPTQLQREFIAASQRYTRQLRNIRRASIIGSAVATLALIFAAVASIVGIQATNQAEEAGTQVAQAQDELTSIPLTLTVVDATNIARIDSVNTEVADSNRTLTNIPPTLTQLSQQVEEAEELVESLQLASDALSVSNAFQIGEENNSQFIELTGPIQLTSPFDNINDLAMSCSVYSEAAGFQIHLRETSESAVTLTFDAGNLTISQRSGDTNPVREFSVNNVFSRGVWIDFSVLFIETRLKIYTQNELVFDRDLRNAPTSGFIRFEARSNDIFRLDRNCISALAYNRNAAEFGNILNEALNRPFQDLRYDLIEDFSDSYRTDFWWVGRLEAAGQFDNDPSAEIHQTYLTITHPESTAFRLFRDAVGVGMFGAGTDASAYSDATDIGALVDVRLGTETSNAYLVVRAKEEEETSSLSGYFLELSRDTASNNYQVHISYRRDEQINVYFDGLLNDTFLDSTSEWVNLMIVAYQDEQAFFINRELIMAISSSEEFGGTIALGVAENSSADFDDLIIRDLTPN